MSGFTCFVGQAFVVRRDAAAGSGQRWGAEDVNLHHIKHHYYESHPTVNPSGIVPKGPALDFDAPHRRGGLKAA